MKQNSHSWNHGFNVFSRRNVWKELNNNCDKNSIQFAKLYGLHLWFKNVSKLVFDLQVSKNKIMALTKEDIAKLPKEVQTALLCQPRIGILQRWLIMFAPIFRLNFKVKMAY
jgi:hypothetical protein